MKAEVWRRDAPNIVFDEFADKPFTHAGDASVYDVRFVDTDDPFFFDARDRKKITPPSLEEEVAFDDAGDAGLSFNEWLSARREADEMPPVEFPIFH